MEIAAVLGNIVGLLGGLCGFLSYLNQRKQTRILQEQIDALSKQDAAYAEWSTRLDQVIEALEKISPQFIQQDQVKRPAAYDVIFSASLRQKIERHLGRRSTFKWTFQPARLTRDQLLSPVVRQLIEEVSQVVETFKKEHTDWSRQLRLLPPR